eukprot:jgi/Mesvir1/16765/Mv15137-RA.1
MATTNAAVTGGKLQLTQGVVASGTASYVSPFPKSLDSFEVTSNIAFSGAQGAASSTKKLFAYGPLIVKLNVPASGTYGTLTVDNGGGVTSTSASAPLKTDGTANKYKIVARRVYFSTTALSTFELFVDGVRVINTTGDGIANLNLTATPSLSLTYASSGSVPSGWLGEWFNDTPNNNTATGASVQNYSITGTSGSFGGVTPVASEVATPSGVTSAGPATTRFVTLSDIDTGTSNNGYGTWSVEARVKVTLDHATLSGYFSTKYGTTGYLVSNYSTTGIIQGTSGLLVTGIVKPVTSFLTATGGSIGTGDAVGTTMSAPFASYPNSTTAATNVGMVELLTIGDTTTAGKYLSVWVWRGGKILMFNGTSFTETNIPVVSTSEFVLGIYLHPTATTPTLYINGVLITDLLAWRTMANNATATVSVANTGVVLSTTSTARGIYLGPRMSYVSGATINAAYKNWRVIDTSINSMTAQQIANTQLYRYSSEYDSGPLTVTYGFRIADDETLQIVKTQGSMATTTDTMLGNILPASEDGTGALTVNSLGAIGSSTVDPVMDLTNKR